MKIDLSPIRAVKIRRTLLFAAMSASLALVIQTPVQAKSAKNPTLPDYDDDGSADIVFRRPASFETIIKRSSDGQTQKATLGRRVGDVPVIGDFDGDGVTDVAVRRATTQYWYVNNSSGVDRVTNYGDGITRKIFGSQVGDIPVPADYDGDGITDIAVRRPSTQYWYILNSSGVDSITGNSDGITRRQFGLQEADIPVPADYDGDGKADLAVRRPGSQFWYILNSSGVDDITGNDDGVTRRRFGTQAADIPVPADYDGDGRADLAVRRPGTQYWYILNSSERDNITGNEDGITRRRFGLRSTDIPVPADYDGDGKTDIAVRRTETSQWFVLNSSGTDSLTSSSDGITRLTFGKQTTDAPIMQPLYSVWLSADIDEDGLTKEQEDALGSDFAASDSDGDGLSDGDEVNTHNTSPTQADTDSDGLSDGDEVNVHSTNPNLSDSDGDGLIDGDEVNVHNTNPNLSDSDGDGLGDGDEVNMHNTDPNNADSDGDGINDGDEINNGSNPNEAEQVEFTESGLIESIVDNIYLPTFELFAQKAAGLDGAVSDYCAALPNDTSNRRGTAQAAWKDAMDTWQMAELMQVGPLFFNGNELRNNVYSWPNKRACYVDQDVVLAEENGYDITSRNVARKGMDALEYLLFDDDLDHKCTVASIAPEGWNDRSDDDRRTARCDFAAIISSDVLATANDIVSQWSGDNGHAATLKDAGNPGSDFNTTLDAINDISDGLFYFTGAMKDGKIATPVGLRANNCGLTPCPDDAEAPYADYSLENIVTNMKALRKLLVGASEQDQSFVDFLNDVGDSNTATNIIVQLDEAISLAEAMTGTYSEILSQNPQSVEQLHDEVNEVDDILKTDFIESLSLELPATSAGDND